MSVMWDEIATDVMKNINDEDNIFSVGRVVNVSNNVVEVAGLKDVAFFEAVSIVNKARGYISAIFDNTVNISLVEQKEKIAVGDKVYTLNKNFKVSFSMDSLGKVVDVFGNDLISGKRFENLLEFDIETEPIDIIDRTEVKREFLTGIAGIDLFYPIGKGQRQLVIGDKKTGKTQICLDMINNQKDKKVLCLYVAIGKTKKEVKEIYYDLVKQGASSYTMIIAAFPDDLPAKSYVTPYAATSLAKFFMMQGLDVLIIFDDLKKHADIYRQMSLAAKKIPGRDAYPSDIFYTHARLLENGCQHKAGGSITMIPVVETKSGDITDYISTNIISICDGQLVLSLKKFNKGERPAINYGLSVSRLGGAVQSRDMKKVGIKIRQDLLSYLEIRDIYELVNLDDLGENMKNRMIEGQKIVTKLNQYKYSPLTKEQMVTLFDDIKEVK
ncbi:MAG: F0F1 ATP synthase subunit alpha [Bacilli bacterium]|nr:F0F1 ATP synthase subunit alpha [Bacilli bacterium]